MVIRPCSFSVHSRRGGKIARQQLLGFDEGGGLIGFDSPRVVGSVAESQLAQGGLDHVRGIESHAKARQIHRLQRDGDGRLLIGVAGHGHVLGQPLLVGQEVDQRQRLVGFGFLGLRIDLGRRVRLVGLGIGGRRRLRPLEDLAVKMHRHRPGRIPGFHPGDEALGQLRRGDAFEAASERIDAGHVIFAGPARPRPTTQASALMMIQTVGKLRNGFRTLTSGTNRQGDEG